MANISPQQLKGLECEVEEALPNITENGLRSLMSAFAELGVKSQPDAIMLTHPHVLVSILGAGQAKKLVAYFNSRSIPVHWIRTDGAGMPEWCVSLLQVMMNALPKISAACNEVVSQHQDIHLKPSYGDRNSDENTITIWIDLVVKAMTMMSATMAKQMEMQAHMVDTLTKTITRQSMLLTKMSLDMAAMHKNHTDAMLKMMHRQEMSEQRNHERTMEITRRARPRRFSDDVPDSYLAI